MNAFEPDTIQIIHGTGISPTIRTVMAMLDCREDNPAYEELLDIFNEHRPVIEKIIKPAGAFCPGELKRKGANDDLTVGRRIIYSMSTIGPEVCAYIDECMKNDVFEGLIVDFMADSCLFLFEEQLKKSIREYCNREGIGILKSYEAPNLIPLETQKDAYEALDAGNILGIEITGGYMLKPIKSNGHIYTISEDPKEFNLQHDCSACPMTTCPMRNMNLL